MKNGEEIEIGGVYEYDTPLGTKRRVRVERIDRRPARSLVWLTRLDAYTADMTGEYNVLESSFRIVATKGVG